MLSIFLTQRFPHLVTMPISSFFSRYTPLIGTVLLILTLTNCGVVRKGTQITETQSRAFPNRASSSQSEKNNVGSSVFKIEEETTGKQQTSPTIKESIQTNNSTISETNDYKNEQVITQNLPIGVAFIQTGIASWYGPDFQGRNTANGEVYNMNEMTAAHKTLPFNTHVIV